MTTMPKKPKAKTNGAAPSGVSRRDFLKYGAMAGAAVGVAALHLSNSGARPAEAASLVEAPGDAPAPAKLTAQQRRANLAFEVDIEGLPETSANVDSVQVEDLTIDVRETTTGADWDYRTYAPGDAHFGKATFKSRVGKNSKELLQWVQEASVGKNVRKNISIIIKDNRGSELRRYNLMECFPIKYDPGDYSPSSNVAVESITVKIGRVELA
jgi:phage tail-like protein